MNTHRSAYFTMALAVVCVSFGSVLVRVAEAPALCVAFYRIFLAVVLLAPLTARRAGQAWRELAGRHRLVALLSGAALALHFAAWIASLEHTSVAASVLLVNMTPVFTAGLARAFLKERVSPAVGRAMAVALLGTALIALGHGSAEAAGLKGDLLALLGAFMLSVHHVAGRGLRGVLPLGSYVVMVWTAAALLLLGLALGSGSRLVGYEPRTYAVFLALAIVPTLGGHGLVNRSLRSLPAATVGVILLGEPIGASLLAAVFLREFPGPLTLAGGTVVLLALVFVVLEGQPARVPRTP